MSSNISGSRLLPRASRKELSAVEKNSMTSPLENKTTNTLDRFIPHSTSQRAYKASTFLNQFSSDDTRVLEDTPRTPQRLSSPEFFTDLERTNYYSALPIAQHDSSTLTSLSSESHSSNRIKKTKKSKKLKQSKIHRKNIANSLDLYAHTKVFQYKNDTITIPGEFKNEIFKLQNSNEMDLRDHRQRSAIYNRKTTRPKSIMPFRVLDARALRNDFYTNLIAWSATSNNILIGLGASVYMWSERAGAIPVMKHAILAERNDFITCVSFSPFNSRIIIGTKNGSIFLYDQDICIRHNKKFSGLVALQPIHEFRRDTSKGIACIEWFHNENSRFVVGAESGEAYIMDITNSTDDQINIKLIGEFQAHSQQSLLATGGGSKDKTIKFWHSPTGTLIKEYKTSSQITSLIWSVNYRQLVVTFGFGDIDNPIVLIAYTYPDLNEMLYVKTPTPLRVLSAVHSPNCTSICVAMNDETIRFYEIWGGSSDIINEYHDKGLYGSEIIEFIEGIHDSYRGKIR
ncbi:similar to Saccharomyces cerevisiae YGR225W AMA1 Activator of meiotic anaphase promoting complex (APC/C) [Maudiozyma saulgeensis]|uniref:Similar to Saccharomyces cerevisiae YGR225W AMA1 Activator of meiotic anaphase promoting complex (APC/C) n=1 Tax=Maudiozyma saulgeensis TaxID=1789683 RepID=A0A1X7RA63_9SACH|nr:similar to Saccharomyces cerevisiae YGR225W AMA1 Activator of meiotic anaphase promoting complex (APC/C) [Kazachstania saulgeensis]